MKINNKRLKTYIYDNTDSKTRSRANAILVKDLKFSPDYKSVTAKVRGSSHNTYTVHFYGIQNGLISSSCSCPYDWGNICKHEVSVAWEIDDFVDKHDPNTALLPKTTKTVIKEKFSPTKPISVPFTDISGITLAYLKKYASKSAMKQEYYYQADVSVVVSNPDYIHLNLLPSYYYDAPSDVQLRKKEDSLSLLCSCKALNKALCIHQVIALKYISQMPNAFLSKEEIEDIKEELLGQYGFSLKDKQHKNHFSFDFSQGEPQVVLKSRGILRLSKYGDHTPFVDLVLADENSLRNELPFVAKKTRQKQKGTAIGFSFYSYDEGYQASVILTPLMGNLKKDLSGFASKIEVIDAKDLIVRSNLFATDDIAILKKAHAVSWGEVDGLMRIKDTNINHYIHTHIKSLIPLLDNGKAYEVDPYYKITKKNMVPIILSDKSTELSFTVEEEECFYALIAHITINGRKSKLSTKKIGDNFLFVKSKDTYYLNKNLNYAKTLASFKKSPEIRVRKEDFKEYYNTLILPLSKKYEVNIKHLKLKGRKLESAEIKKQIYLTEVDEHIVFRPILQHKDTMINVLSPQEVIETVKNDTYKIKRNTSFENDFIKEITDLHPRFQEQQEESFFYLSLQELVEKAWFLSAFATLKQHGIEIFGFDKLTSLKYNPNKPTISMSVSSGLDWFDVNISVVFGNLSVSLKDLKKSVIAKERYIKLSDGSIGILPEEWLKKHTHLFRAGDVQKSSVKVSKYQLSVIDSLYEQLDHTSEMVKNHDSIKKMLKEFKSIDKVKIPKGIKATLRDYQKEGLNWLNFLDTFGFGGCLADDMGLGKTLQVITFFQYLKNSKKTENPHLVIVPTSLIFNWLEEIKKFCPTLNVLNLTGGNRQKSTFDFKGHDIVLTTYGTLLRDVARLKEHKFDYIVLDESQAIKNPNSKRYKAVRSLQSRNRLVLTGTPIENNTFDIYSQMTFVNPGLLGNIANFKREFATPIDKNKNHKVAEELSKLISPFLLRRTKDQVAKELPSKTEQIFYCTMGKAQQDLYDAYRNKYRDYLMGKIEDVGLGKSKMYVLEGLTKLRQICDSPKLLKDIENYTAPSVKIDELTIQLSEKTGNHKVLVFSQFVKMLHLIKERLDEHKIPYEYLDGRTKNRQEKVANFQNDPNIRVFLISLKAGGTGLNLTAADYVYLVDPWWNPAVEAQAIDRCYRIGQDKKVMAYKMICKGTVEEKIVLMQATKKQLSANIIKTDESFVKSLSKESIIDLFTVPN
ncbi:DEAD/DEAH box helicase-like protein [hydrothermal vent metagenome]|uniref:DEAD/DEAH box helicase-like protein n=1 Tax=hydrothermal vent metagenome TaxID=652676 RepID=A0A3B0T4I6_9ZZZZ